MSAQTARQVVVGVADAKIGSDPDSIIVTYALGSCLGITLYDPQRKIGGLLHIMLPNSVDHPQSAARRAMFVDTGMPDLLDGLSRRGADLRILECKVFGGAKVTSADNYFSIGQKNITAFQTLADKLRLRVLAWEVGGNINRTIKLSIQTGKVSVRTPAQPEFIR